MSSVDPKRIIKQTFERASVRCSLRFILDVTFQITPENDEDIKKIINGCREFIHDLSDFATDSRNTLSFVHNVTGKCNHLQMDIHIMTEHKNYSEIFSIQKFLKNLPIITALIIRYML